MKPDDQYILGRWFTVILFKLSNYADIPVFNPLLATVFNVLTGLFVTTMWEKDKKTSTTTLTCITLLISIYPAMLTAYYFTPTTNMFIGATFIATIGLYITSKLQFLRVSIGAVLIMLAMATYQPSLSVFAVLFMTFIILLIVEHRGELDLIWVAFKSLLLPKLLAIFFGGILYRLSLPILGINVGEIHSTKTTPFAELPQRFIQVFLESFKALWYTQPELLSPIKEILLAATSIAILILVIVTLKNSSKLSLKAIKTALLLFSILGLVISTKALFLVSSDNAFWQYRYNFALAFFYAFVFFILLEYTKWPLLKNVFLLVCMFVVLRYGQADLIRQAVLLRGQQHDLAIANRILYRIESLPDIDFSKKYYLVRTGAYSRMRIVSLQSNGHSFQRGGDGHMDRGDISDMWTPASVMLLLGTKVKWKGLHVMPDFLKKIEFAKELAKKQGRKPWPHSSSVFIYEDWVVVHM